MPRHLRLAAVAALILSVGWLSATGTTSAPSVFSMAAHAQAAGPTEAQLALAPDLSIGSADAPLTIIEYASFTCPHCAEFHNTIFDQLKADYIDTGKVRLIMRDAYSDQHAFTAALIARCDGGSKFFEIADILYDRQETWIAGGDPAMISVNLLNIGLEAGLSGAQTAECIADPKMMEALITIYQWNITEDEVQGTPSFVIGDTTHTNMAYEELKKLLDAELSN